jgi:hypothetical protein
MTTEHFPPFGSPNVPEWSEVDGSPFEVTGPTATFSLPDVGELLLIPDPGNPFDEMQINGETGPDYDYVNSDGTKTTDDDRFNFGLANLQRYSHIRYRARFGFISANLMGEFGVSLVRGTLTTSTSVASQITVIEENNLSRTGTFRAYEFSR